ncbi:hypothetical protein ACFQX6_15685 [Streptosporangium lutulentum]
MTEGMPASYFDTIVINSVIQYFPSIDHLTEVIRGAMGLLAPGGALFVGDVRNLRQARAFHTGIQLTRSGRTPTPSTSAEPSSGTSRWRRNSSSTPTTSPPWASASTCAPSAGTTTTS